MKRSVMVLAGVLLLLPACEPKEMNLGSVHGRILSPDGHPVRGARVALDGMNGRTVVTNVSGEFRISAAPTGTHTLYAVSAGAASAAQILVTLTDGNVNTGDVPLTPCDPVPLGGDGNGGGGDGDPNTDPPSDPSDPCNWDPPPPPEDHIVIETFEADYADAFVDSWGIYGFGDDAGAQASLDFFVEGDFTQGGSFSGHVSNDLTNWDVSVWVGLFVYDSYGYYYALTEGDIEVTTSDADGDGTLDYKFKGTNMKFVYLNWFDENGGIDPTHTAEVGSAEMAGETWSWEPPSPPPGDITIDPFVADFVDIVLIEDGVILPDGTSAADYVYVYAYDSSNNADVYFGTAVDELALPGDSDLLGWLNGGTADGFASVYDDSNGDGWWYELNNLALSTDATGLAIGEEVTLTIVNSQFDFYGGGIIVEPTDPDPAPNEPTTPGGVEVEYHLFINNGDLTGVVNDGGGWCGTEPVETPEG